jgi:hypothetical protein
VDSSAEDLGEQTKREILAARREDGERSRLDSALPNNAQSRGSSKGWFAAFCQLPDRQEEKPNLDCRVAITDSGQMDNFLNNSIT